VEIQELHLTGAPLSDRFLQADLDGPLANTKLLLSLRRLHMEDITLGDDDWCPLLPCFAHQASGGQLISFALYGEPIHICKDVVKNVESLIEELSSI
jgi:hypothetical protein